MKVFGWETYIVELLRPRTEHGHISWLVFGLPGAYDTRLLLIPALFWSGVTKPALVAMASVLVYNQIVEAVKTWVQRERPPGPLRNESFGFPSGDVALVVAVWPALLGWWAAVPAVLVGLSRIARGAHYPLDVLGGAAVGGAMFVIGQLIAGWF